MRAVLTAIAVALLACGTATADSGPGVYEITNDRTEGELLLAAGAVPLDQIGENVLRFTGAMPMAVYPAVVIEIRGDRRDHARGLVIVLRQTEPGVWQRRTVRRFDVSVGDFDRLATTTDIALANWTGDEPFVPKPRLSDDDPTEVGAVCFDGPSYLTERRVKGQSRWQSGYCGDDHPNNAVARQVWGLLPPDVRRMVPYLKDGG